LINQLTKQTDRVLLLSKFHERNLHFVVDTLLNNDYPLNFIFNTINKRLKYYFKKHIRSNSNNNEEDVRLRWFTILYIPIVSEKLKDNYRFRYQYLISNWDILLITKMLSQYLVQKIVYKILCNDCDASYIGQTSSNFKKTHIKEHRSYINRNTTTQSVIVNHGIHHNHNFKWDNVEIIDKKPFLSKKLTSEMLYIRDVTDTYVLYPCAIQIWYVCVSDIPQISLRQASASAVRACYICSSDIPRQMVGDLIPHDLPSLLVRSHCRL